MRWFGQDCAQALPSRESPAQNTSAYLSPTRRRSQISAEDDRERMIRRDAPGIEKTLSPMRPTADASDLGRMRRMPAYVPDLVKGQHQDDEADDDEIRHRHRRRDAQDPG